MKKNIIIAACITVVLIFAIGGTMFAFRSGNTTSTGNSQTTDSTSTVTNETSPSAAPSASPAPTTDPSSPKPKVKAKGLYLTGWTVGNLLNVKHYVDLANTTEINAYVVDVKDDDGYVGYESQIPAVREQKAWQKKFDVDKVIKEFHDNNVYVIGRVVCFKDPVLSSKNPERAIKRSNGTLWRDNHGLTWLDPYNKENWKYVIEIAKEAVKKGFDEIQFDYVRFANDGDKKAMTFPANDGKNKHEAIEGFLAYARQEMPNVVLSADVFGIICESPGDTEGIGQYLENVGKNIDYISPMVYPSHYAVGQKVNGVAFAKPDLDPYGVVYNTLLKAKNRIAKVDGYKAGVRPYLQDFTASWLGKGYYMSYGAEQVRQQIKATYDAGYEEWLLWDANNRYSEEAFQKEN